jgi:DNA-binding Xre family transcriptional regulator
MRPANDRKQPAATEGLTGLDWRLHAVMADRGIKFAKDLQDALARDGYPVSASSISRLVYQEPKQLDIRLLSSLCRVLGCTPDELLVPRRGNPHS